MIEAILYTSNTGSAEQYARLLSEKLGGLPTFTLKQAAKALKRGMEIIYVGWIMAGVVKGYAAAAKRYGVRAVCGVGMGQTGSQTDIVRQKTHITSKIPLFTLQGNFCVDKLRGFYRLMMKLMVKAAVKDLGSKENRTPQENDMLDMMLNGNDRVKAENLQAVLDWYDGAQ